MSQPAQRKVPGPESRGRGISALLTPDPPPCRGCNVELQVVERMTHCGAKCTRHPRAKPGHLAKTRVAICPTCDMTRPEKPAA